MLTKSLRLLLYGILACGFLSCVVAQQADLEKGFVSPPHSAKPWTFWFWMNGNLNKSAITADLEAMAKAGMGGVLIMEVARTNNMAPDGPVKFASREWRDIFRHVVSEANRLGLEVNMNNDAGWCGSGGPWVKPESSMQKLVSGERRIKGPQRFTGSIPTGEALRGYYKDVSVLAFPAGKKKGGDPIDSGSIIDLTAKMQPGGVLTWDAPEGDWQVLRVGVTTTGRVNKPAPASGEGLECDKLDPDALKAHFEAFINVLAKDSPETLGKSFTMTHIDSWEVGTQDWTASMPQEFRKRRGYDLQPWLPALAGNHTVASKEQTDRFRRDFRRTCSELLLEGYAGALRDLAHKKKLKLSIEAYGTGDYLNPLDYAAECDLPMSEFWINRWSAWHLLSPRLMASVAHVYGRRVTGAEAFTSWAEADQYTEHPYSVKTIGDWAFTEGVNRMVFHRGVLQPWEEHQPGMSFAGFGWHADRHQTWWNDFSGYLSYLARCQWLLQQGHFVADVCRLVPQGEDFGGPGKMALLPGLYEALPEGFGYDYLSDKAVLEELSARQGRIVTRAGMSYRMMQLPRTNQFTPELMRNLARLVKNGAVISGGRPDRSPSLQGYPRCDEEVRKLAAQLWDGANGRVTAADPAQVLENLGAGPDFRFVIDPPITDESIMSVTQGRGIPHGKEKLGLMPTKGLNWIHRRVGDQEIYFVANAQHRPVSALCEFRVKGLEPEIWNPMTGEVRPQPVFKEISSGTIVPISFDHAGSVFVVFRKKSIPARNITEVRGPEGLLFGQGLEKPKVLPEMIWEANRIAMNGGSAGAYALAWADGRREEVVVSKPAVIRIPGPWRVEFQPNRGAPARAEFAELSDWSTHSDPGIRHFSGTAAYQTSFDWQPSQKGRRYYLDLGQVQITARVKVNGKEFGPLWKPPFIIDITEDLKAGDNKLEVKVTNLWPNRMIGDEQYPDDCTPDGSWKHGPLLQWPEWLLKGEPRPEPRRVTFTTWKYFGKDAPLTSSGLIGPVSIEAR